MTRWGHVSLGLVVLSTTLGLAGVRPTSAQECMVATFGPLTLASRNGVATVCATNLDAQASRRVGFAVYDAFDAREPLRLEHADLARGAGTCLSFRPTRTALTFVIRVGFIRASDDPAQPIALSLRSTAGVGDVDGRDFLVWQRGGDPPPPPPPV